MNCRKSNLLMFADSVFFADVQKVTSTLKGPVDPRCLLNFQIVDKGALADAPSQKAVATLLHPLFSDLHSDTTPVDEAAARDLDGSATTAEVTQESTSNAIDCTKEQPLSLVAKRLSLSGRRTLGLQGSGLTTINEQFVEGQISDPILHGYEEHYRLVGCWRSRKFGVLSRSNGASSEEQLELRKNRPLTLSRYLKLQEPKETEPIIAIPSFDFSKYNYSRRTKDKKCWPASNVNAISSKKNLAETLTYGPVMKPLALEGIIPCVCYPNPKDAAQTLRVTFGPPLDSVHNPIQPGARYEAAAVYDQLRMKNAVDHHDAWHSHYWNADGLNLRLPPKSGLPIDSEIIEAKSPIGELLRIDDGRAREGFIFYGSGGNPVINGLAPPDAKAKKTVSRDAAEGATFETCQSILNKMNRIMQQICESGRPLKVFLSGDMLPKHLYDDSLAAEIGRGTEQSVYMGVYHVKWCGQEEPLSGSDLLRIVDVYKDFYPALKIAQLRFLLAVSKKFMLIPDDNYVVRPGGYQHLEVDTRDDRKPVYELSKGTTIDNIFCGLDDNTGVTETSTFLDWVKGRGYLELVETPYTPPVITKTTANDDKVEGASEGRPHPYAAKIVEKPTRMVGKRTNSFEKN